MVLLTSGPAKIPEIVFEPTSLSERLCPLPELLADDAFNRWNEW